MTTADCESSSQEHSAAQETNADAYAAAKEKVRQEYENLSMKISPLLQSAIVGDLHSIQAWLQTPGIDINEIDENSFTVLFAAVEGGSIEIVRTLLATPGIDVNATDKNGFSVLAMAVSRGSIKVVQALLAMPGIDVNAPDKYGSTALAEAVTRGYTEVVQALLAMPGIDVNAIDRSFETGLAWAVRQKAPSIVESLLAAQGFKVSFQEFMDRHREFAAAIKVGNIAMIQSLLADTPWIDINFKLSHRTVLHVAIQNSHPEVVHFLLTVPDIEYAAHELCMFAARKGDLRLLQLMMDRPGFDVNRLVYSSHSYLTSAAENGHFPIVRALLAIPGIDINVGGDGRTALLGAAKYDHRQIALVLAAMPGIDVHASIEDDHGYFKYCGCTALMVAAGKGNLLLVRTLLTTEAINVNLKDNRGYTALMLAAFHGHLEIVRALLAVPGIAVEAWSNKFPLGRDYMDHYDENGSSVSWRDAERPRRPLFSALSLAETTGRTEIVEALLAMPVSAEFIHLKLAKHLGSGSYLSSLKSRKKSIPTSEETCRFLHQTLHPGSDSNLPTVSLPPQQKPVDPQHAAWIDDKCIAVSLGACPASDVPFLLQSTIPLPAWCQSSLANAIALGFISGHYYNAPDLIWQTVQGTRAWLAGLAFGAGQSRQDAIELDPGIGYQLESMHLWKEFLNALEYLRQLKADPDGYVIDKLTLLGRAARDGDLPMIKVLVALGANIHLRSPNGDVPIVAAAKAGQWAACAELFSIGAMPVMGDNKGNSALYYIASAFARSDTTTPALASLIRYLRLKKVRFDIPMPNPDEQDREENPIVLVSDILFSDPESWVRFGKIIFGIVDEPLPALPIVPTPQSQQPISSKAQVHAMLHSANPEAALAAWLDADPQHLHWRDPDNDQTLLHLATASQNIGLVQLLLNRGIVRTHVDRAGQTAAQLLPADYMSSHTPAAKRIAELLH